MEQAQTDQKYFEGTQDMCHKIPDHPGSVKIKKNNVTTRVSAKPPAMVCNQNTKTRSLSSSEFRYDESSASSSSICTSTPISGTTQLASEKTEDSNKSRPNYMNLTESIKAKQNTCSSDRNMNYECSKREAFSQSNVGSDPSLHLSKLSGRKDKSLTRNHGPGGLLL